MLSSLPGIKPYLKLTTFILCFFFWSVASAQISGYIIDKDSVYSQGFIKFDIRKPRQVEFSLSKKSEPTMYSPDQLTEFGYQESNIIESPKYIAREVLYNGQVQKIFMQIVAEGNLNIYLVSGSEGKEFYIDKGNLVQLKKEDFKETLRSHSNDCKKNDWQLERLRLAHLSLEHYGKNLNKGHCTSVHFSSFGALAGLNVSTFKANAEPSSTKDEFGKYTMVSENLDAGLFADVPVWLVNNVSIVSQLSYGQMKFNKILSSPTLDQDVKLELELLKFDLKPKYSFHLNKIDFFIEAGTEVLYVLSQSGQLYKSRRTGTSIQLGDDIEEFTYKMSSYQFGIVAGAGVMFFYTPKQYVSLGFHVVNTSDKSHSIQNISSTIMVNL